MVQLLSIGGGYDSGWQYEASYNTNYDTGDCKSELGIANCALGALPVTL